MTAALLTVRIEKSDFYGFATAILPFDLNVGLTHILLPSQLVAFEQRGVPLTSG
jgi:hypothetical protein